MYIRSMWAIERCAHSGVCILTLLKAGVDFVGEHALRVLGADEAQAVDLGQLRVPSSKQQRLQYAMLRCTQLAHLPCQVARISRQQASRIRAQSGEW